MNQNQTGIQKKAIHWYPGHMAKTRRIIEENLKLVDVVVEIIDARIPYSGRNPYFDDMLKSKKRLIVMNKYDLSDKAVSKQWIEHFALKGIKVVPISCFTGEGINKIFTESEKLVSDKINEDLAKGRRRTLKLMMIGIPNVGKSSLINKLVGRASTVTGNKPGVTKGKQWIRIRGNCELLDTPGILPQKFTDEKVAENLAITGAIKDEIINIELLSYNLVDYIIKHYPELLKARYKITEDIFSLETYEIIELIGRKRGFVISGGEIDTERTAKMLIDEFRANKMGNITLERPDEIIKRS